MNIAVDRHAANSVLLLCRVQFVFRPSDELPRRENLYEPPEAKNPTPQRVVIGDVERHDARSIGPIVELLRCMSCALFHERRDLGMKSEPYFGRRTTAVHAQ